MINHQMHVPVTSIQHQHHLIILIQVSINFAMVSKKDLNDIFKNNSTEGFIFHENPITGCSGLINNKDKSCFGKRQ
jgi:hypothetical protein